MKGVVPMRNKITYTISDADGFLAMCHRMNASFVPTGSRVYAEMRVTKKTDHDFIVAPYLWQLGEPMKEFLRTYNSGVMPAAKVEALCPDTSGYAGDPFFTEDRADTPVPEKEEGLAGFDGVVYVTSPDEEVKINLIFTRTVAEFGGWCCATDTLKFAHGDAMRIIWDKGYRVRKFKQLRDEYMRACVPHMKSEAAVLPSPF